MEHAEAIERARNAFRSGKTRDLVWRQNQLRALICLLDENMDRIRTVLRNDLNKVDVETEIEVTSVHNEAAEGLTKFPNKKFPKSFQKKNSEKISKKFSEFSFAKFPEIFYRKSSKNSLEPFF